MTEGEGRIKSGRKKGIKRGKKWVRWNRERERERE